MSTTTTPMHGTWIAQGQPQAFTYWGRKGSGPAAEGKQVAKVTRDRNLLTLLTADDALVEQVGVTAKLWISGLTVLEAEQAAASSMDASIVPQPCGNCTRNPGLASDQAHEPAWCQDCLDAEAEAAAEDTALAAEGQDASGLEQVSDYLASQPVRATWKGHGNPSEFAYLGTQTASPAAEAQQVVKVETGPGGRITFTTSTGATISSVSNATKFWAVVPAQADQPAKPKAAKSTPRTAAAPTGKRAEAIAALQPKAPAGYDVLWPHASHSLLKANSSAPEGSSPWLTMCNQHGTTTKADNARDGETKGTKAQRQVWCKQCKAAAAKAEAAAEPTAEHDSAAASK
jgi:hypothetical protein